MKLLIFTGIRPAVFARGGRPPTPGKFHPMKLLTGILCGGLKPHSLLTCALKLNRSVFSSYLSLRRRAVKLIFKQFWVSFWPRFASKIRHFGVLGAPWGQLLSEPSAPSAKAYFQAILGLILGSVCVQNSSFWGPWGPLGTALAAGRLECSILAPSCSSLALHVFIRYTTPVGRIGPSGGRPCTA